MLVSTMFLSIKNITLLENEPVDLALVFCVRAILVVVVKS